MSHYFVALNTQYTTFVSLPYNSFSFFEQSCIMLKSKIFSFHLQTEFISDFFDISVFFWFLHVSL